MYYKIDILEALKNAGYTTYRLRREKILGESTIQWLRNGNMLTLHQLEKICNILNCDIGDLVTVKPD